MMSERGFVVRLGFEMLPAVLQERVIRKFLPSELIPAGWSCQERSLIENVRNLYETSNIRIRMYGSPEKLEIILRDLMSLPGNQKFFQFDDSVFYRTFVHRYQSLRNNIYIYRIDVYDLLYGYTPTFNALPPIRKLFQNLVCYFLRTLRNMLPISHEMVLIDDNFKKRLFIGQQLVEKKIKTGEWKKLKTFSDFDPKDNDDLLKRINDTFMDSKIRAGISEEMRKTVTMVTNHVPFNENASEYRNLLVLLYFTFVNIEICITDNKSVMLSRSETVHSVPPCKIPIRLFENDHEKVVMSHELLHAIKLEKLDVSGFEDKILATPTLSVMSFREVFETVPNSIFKMLEFIKIPLNDMTKELRIHPTIDGSYCISAYQFLMMILDDVVLVKKLFQGMKRNQLPHVMEELCTLLEGTLCQETFFVSYERYEETKSFLTTWFERNFPSPNQKEISRVPKKGFTCEDLKNQFERLELSEVFPRIAEYAYRIPADLPIDESACTTEVMLQLIENTQLSYVFNYLSKPLVAIFHKRKWCIHLIPGRCPHCSGNQTDEPSVKTAEDSSVSVESKTVEEEEKLDEILVTSPGASSVEETSEKSSTEQSEDSSKPESISSSTPDETVVAEKQESVRKPKKPKKKIEKSVVKPEEKESEACPKCIRASEYTKTTNEKLRLSKIEVKHLRKDLSVVELALEEKNERIRMLEEKLRERENQLNLQSSEMERLKTKNQELELENGRNKRLMSTFPQVISKKDSAIKSLQYQNHEKDKMLERIKSGKLNTIPTRSKEESEKVDCVLSNLLETKNVLSKEDPVRRSSEVCEAVIARTNSKITQQLVKYETKVFQLQVSSYIQLVENNIKIVEGNQHIKMNQIPEVPYFPEYSEEFKNVHKLVMKKEAPLLCRQLLNLTDEIADMKCAICITEMESHDGTTKCVNCKRRYHNHCISDWLKVNSICPMCKKPMVDEQEFPAL